MATDEKVKTAGWTIAVGDWPHFDIKPASPIRGTHSDEFTNGVFPSRAAALDNVIAGYEAARTKLSEQIARARRMRRRAAQGIEARSGETAKQARSEGRKPGAEGVRPTSTQEQPQ